MTIAKTVVEQTPSVGTVCPTCGSDQWDGALEAPDRFHGRSQLYRLERCRGCSLVRLQNPPPPSDIGQHYGVDYDRAIGNAGEDPEHWYERRDYLLKLKSRGAILDLGCNTGGFLSTLKGPNWQLYGVEMSEIVAEQARKRCGADVFVGDILDAPFAPASFDVITAFHVMEHLYEPREVLAKVSEWLRPGGVFYAMMPNIDSAGARIFGTYWYPLELPRHLFHFSPASFRRLIGPVGLQELSITTHREVYIESSVRYIFDEFCRRIGYTRVPMAKATKPGIPWRVIRKMFRLTVLPVLTGAASLAGDGESLNVVLRKA